MLRQVERVVEKVLSDNGSTAFFLQFSILSGVSGSIASRRLETFPPLPTLGPAAQTGAGRAGTAGEPGTYPQ